MEVIGDQATPTAGAQMEVPSGPVFGPLLLDGWNAIPHLPPVQTVGPNQLLFQEGSAVSSVFLIRKGFVKLRCVSSGGHEMIVGLRSRGWLLGVDSAFLSRPHRYTAVTLTECQLSAFSRAELLRSEHTNACMRGLLSRLLSQEAQVQLAAQVGLRAESAEERLRKFFEDLRHLPPDNQFDLACMTQVELSQLLSVTPEHLCRLLRKLRTGSPGRPTAAPATTVACAGLPCS